MSPIQIRYTLREFDNSTPLDGSWYEEELNKVQAREFVVEKILKRRVNNRGVKEVLIKWLGYPNKYSSWEPESAVRDIRGRPY